MILVVAFTKARTIFLDLTNAFDKARLYLMIKNMLLLRFDSFAFQIEFISIYLQMYITNFKR